MQYFHQAIVELLDFAIFFCGEQMFQALFGSGKILGSFRDFLLPEKEL